MAKYTVITPVQLKKKRFEPGEVVEIDDENAEGLLASGSIEKYDAKKAAASKAAETPAE